MATRLFLVILFAVSFAQANGNIIKYGRDLCDKVSFRANTLKACEDWVIDNSGNNVYSIALNVCIGFNEGPTSRSAECFKRASQWIPSQDVKDQTDLCFARNGNYAPVAECLRSFYSKMNNKIYAAQENQQEQPKQQTSSFK